MTHACRDAICLSEFLNFHSNIYVFNCLTVQSQSSHNISTAYISLSYILMFDEICSDCIFTLQVYLNTFQQFRYQYLVFLYLKINYIGKTFLFKIASFWRYLIIALSLSLSLLLITEVSFTSIYFKQVGWTVKHGLFLHLKLCILMRTCYTWRG